MPAPSPLFSLLPCPELPPVLPEHLKAVNKPANLAPGLNNNYWQELQAAGFLETLLKDKTGKKAIIWATDAFASLGSGFARTDYLTPAAFIESGAELAKLRSQMRQQSARKHGEVLTPLTICKQMCEHAHEALWTEDWQKYVQATVLEITCGEAPFLVSRKDRATGEKIPICVRIGLLDRKLQLVNAKTKTKAEWLAWAYKAFQATYGYELQGYNLLLARLNLLKTFAEYHLNRWEQKSGYAEYAQILEIITWNLW